MFWADICVGQLEEFWLKLVSNVPLEREASKNVKTFLEQYFFHIDHNNK